jgi:phosphatidylcholine synthase
LICLLLAMRAGVSGDWRLAFAWLAVATLIDAVDGVLARRVGVKEVLPGFDGTLLDNVIDFVGYVFVPAFFLRPFASLPHFSSARPTPRQPTITSKAFRPIGTSSCCICWRCD